MKFYAESTFQNFQSEKIPVNWKVAEIKDIASVKEGIYGKRSDDGDILQLKADSIRDDGKINNHAFAKITIDRMVNDYLLSAGDVLLNNRNSAALVGKSAIFRGEFSECVFGNLLTRIRMHSKDVLPEWLLYRLMQLQGQGFLRAISTRAVNQALLKKGTVEKIAIPVPPISEQYQIMKVLDATDSAIELADKVIAKTERLKKGLMQQLLTKGIGHTEYKDTPIGKIPNYWQVAQLREYADFRNGINFNSEQRTSTGTLTIDVRNMYGEGIYVDLKDLYRVNISENEDCLLKKGDVLFVRSSLKRQGTGWSSLFGGSKESVTFCSFIIRARLRDKSTLLPEFLTYFLRSDVARRKLVANAGQVAISNITQDSLNALKFPIPPKEEQQKIVDIIATIDEKMRFEIIEKTKIEHIKQGLMDLLLTGKIRIKVD